LKFIAANGGSAINSLMQERHFRDVGIGNNTTPAMRKMVDEEKLKMKINHARSNGSCQRLKTGK
jgi:hypothetical protein